MDASHESTLQGRQSPGGSRTLSRLDEVGAEVLLKAQLANLANENVDSAEGTRYPYSIEPASGPQPASSM